MLGKTTIIQTCPDLAIIHKMKLKLSLSFLPPPKFNVGCSERERWIAGRRIDKAKLTKKPGVKTALGSLQLIREKVGSGAGCLYLDQSRTTGSG
jgi:hypothetical protein